MRRCSVSFVSVAAAACMAAAAILPAGADEVPTGGVELPIPQLARDRDPSPGRAEFTLTAADGTVEFLPGKQTQTNGYNGPFLGPTIRVSRGDEVTINVRNELDEVTTVHWHGLHVPAEMDGGPHQMIDPSEVWSPRFTVMQEAATLWYHPHPMGRTGIQVYRGMAGFLIIDDENSGSLRLPSEYGVDDIPVVVQERRFSEAGQFVYAVGMPDVMHGVLGDRMLTNGVIRPTLTAARDLIRIRLLNGSDSSIHRFTLDDGSGFSMIASDGGFLEAPISLQDLVLSPGERAELLVDLSNLGSGESVVLIAETYGGVTHEALEIVRAAGDRPAGLLDVPERLNTIERIRQDEADEVRRFDMEMLPGGVLRINGEQMDMDRVNVRVPLGNTEIWEITNQGFMMMNTPHSFHVHDVQFQVLSVNGRPPGPEEAGWKDTVLVWPNDVVRIIMRFENFTGLYMYHCHLLIHEDQGMMGQFEVYRP